MTLKQEIKKQKKILKNLEKKQLNQKIDKKMEKISNLKEGKTLKFEFDSRNLGNTQDVNIVCFFKVKKTKKGYYIDAALDWWNESYIHWMYQGTFNIKELRKYIFEYINEAEQ